ncbi:hypothetical protein [Pseudoalteromonas distincta]|uniref:hypothetical protein n=1 Tax=Pseudoalteromonas distincta TaxID=77608 RepID=UPI0002EDD668|nr:hypothetical protein [Pseudoalteromonas distincta]
MPHNIPVKFSKDFFEKEVLPKVQNKAHKNYLKELYVLSHDKENYLLPAGLKEDSSLKLNHILAISGVIDFKGLEDVAIAFREELKSKDKILLYAYNGTGKTRLSMEFKDLGRDEDNRDTLYFNAFTEDLFSWNNDLINDENRELRLNKDSRFFDAIEQLEMDTRIRKVLSRYADFDFRILTKNEADRIITYVSFERETLVNEERKKYKISRCLAVKRIHLYGAFS